MSASKSKYFTVTTTTVVHALNKADAEKAAKGRRGYGRVLAQTSSVDRVMAAEARELAATN